MFSAGTVIPPTVDSIIHAHREGGASLTVMFESESENIDSNHRPLEIYACDTSVLQYIPQKGYCDIKEGLISALLRAGVAAHYAIGHQPVKSFRDRPGYLTTIAEYLENTDILDRQFPNWRNPDSTNLWIAKNARIHHTARIFGPAIIMDNAFICEYAVILGPTIVEPYVHIGKDTLIESSVLWNRAAVGANCQIHNCLLDHNVRTSDT